MPDHVTISWWKEERGERIFVDFNQMARDRTIASAYSIRPTPNAVVSAPLTWDELSEVAPEDFAVPRMRRGSPVSATSGARSTPQEPPGLDGALEMFERDVREMGSGSTAVRRCRTRPTTQDAGRAVAGAAQSDDSGDKGE